jgi:esterase/lipase
MPVKTQSHDELQRIEHLNKVLEQHLELVNTVTTLSEEKIQDMLKNYQTYVHVLREVQVALGDIVTNIHRSMSQLKGVTGGAQDIMSYVQAASKLNDLLDDKLIAKLRRITHAETTSTDNRDSA